MAELTEHIVITGASRGIGAAIAKSWCQSFPGTRMSLLARSKADLENLVADCQDFGADAVAFPCDLTDSEAVTVTCRMILEKNGTPTVLVNNAGMYQPGGITDTSFIDFNTQIQLNLTSAFQITSLLIPGMIKNGSGHIFFMGSVASLFAYPGSIAYNSAKHGLLGLARSIREETKGQGIRVTSLLPGATLTASWSGTDLPEQRFMPAADIAAAIISAYTMSDRTVVEEILLRPQLGDI